MVFQPGMGFCSSRGPAKLLQPLQGAAGKEQLALRLFPRMVPRVCPGTLSSLSLSDAVAVCDAVAQTEVASLPSLLFLA